MRLRWIAAAALLACVACDQDPFRLRQRTVLRDYRLERWEDGQTFYLARPGERNEGGGAIDGIVLRIGWNDRYILVERKATFAGDGDGWMILDTATRARSGPFSSAGLRGRAEVRGIRAVAAHEAWERLD